jgi:hypothetical protein
MTVMEAGVPKRETWRRIWSNMLSEIEAEHLTEKAAQEHKAKERQVDDGEAEARTRKWEALMRDLKEWWEMSNEQAAYEATAGVSEARNTRNAQGAYLSAAEEYRRRDAEKHREWEEKEHREEREEERR